MVYVPKVMPTFYETLKRGRTEDGFDWTVKQLLIRMGRRVYYL